MTDNRGRIGKPMNGIAQRVRTGETDRAKLADHISWVSSRTDVVHEPAFRRTHRFAAGDEDRAADVDASIACHRADARARAGAPANQYGPASCAALGDPRHHRPEIVGRQVRRPRHRPAQQACFEHQQIGHDPVWSGIPHGAAAREPTRCRPAASRFTCAEEQTGRSGKMEWSVAVTRSSAPISRR